MGLSKPTRATGLLGLIVVLLAALTGLQYGWIAELSGFQRQQMERALRSSTERFARDLDGQLERLWYAFHVRASRNPGEEIAQDYGEWAESFDVPEIVAEAYWVRETPRAGPGGAPGDRLSIAEISLQEGRFQPTEDWPTWLEELRGALIESADGHEGRRFHESDSFTAPAGEEGAAFVVAQTQLESKSWAVVLLQREALVDRFLPELVRAHFGADHERDYEVRIFDEALNGSTIFASSTEGAATAASSPDLVRHLRDFGGSFRDNDRGGSRTMAVAVTHRAGSLDAAVARLRRRNLAFGFGIILVLGASVGTLAVAARRARRLAARQMEFVAGVSHELRTPIAGISSLSQNLADGVVQDLEHAARYGETIHKESRRLANMVEGVLHFSAIRSGRYRYAMRELNAREIVDTAISTLETAAGRASSLNVDVPQDLPPLHGDEAALQSVVRNLLSNAIKFSGDVGSVRVSAAAIEGRDASGIELRVEDTGPGIDAAELSHVFEPFFRGSRARRRQIEGSGLGLSLVKEIVDAHGGAVAVSSNPDKGTTVTVYLPVSGPAEVAESRRRPAGSGRLQPAGPDNGAGWGTP